MRIKEVRPCVELPDGIELDAGPLRVRQVGRTVVLEPVDVPERIPPGYYTPETLPPLSEGARKILASVDAAVARLRKARSPSQFAGSESCEDELIELEDAEDGIVPSDEPLPGIDPDR